jgi:hypothetical protein
MMLAIGDLGFPPPASLRGAESAEAISTAARGMRLLASLATTTGGGGSPPPLAATGASPAAADLLSARSFTCGRCRHLEPELAVGLAITSMARSSWMMSRVAGSIVTGCAARRRTSPSARPPSRRRRTCRELLIVSKMARIKSQPPPS